MQRLQRRCPLRLAWLMKQLLHRRPALLAGAALLPLMISTQAQAREISFDIPAQPLWSALQEWGRQSDFQVLVNPDDIQGKTSSPVQGRYSPEQAVQILLRHTQINYSLAGDTLTLVMTQTSSTLDITPTSISAEPLDPTTEGTGSYTTPMLTIGKSAESLRRTPQSVTVMTRQLMDDRNLTSLDQVLAQTPGMTFGQRNYGSHLYQSRGFAVNDESYMMDGIPGQAYNPTAWLPTDMAIYDRVEVLRGAAGLLIGAGSPGGAVNLVRKHASAEPRLTLIARAGSWDNYRLDLDAGGKLNDDGSVRGRFITAYEDDGSYLDEKHTSAPLFYGIVDIDLDEDTVLTTSLRRQTSDVRGYSIFGLPRYSDGTALDVPRSTALVQDWNRHQPEITEVFGEIAHRFNDDWTGKLSLIHSEGGFHQSIAYARGAVDPVTGSGSQFRGVEFRHTDIDSTGVDSVLDGHFELFGQAHQISSGVNWSRQTVLEKRAPLALRIPIDLEDVDHDAFPKPARPAWSAINRVVDERYGMFTKANLHLADPLALILGARLSWYTYDFDYRIGGGDFTDHQQARVTPFAGLIYDLDDDWSWYASYTDIFQPQSIYRSVDGSTLDPSIGASYETGIKGELLDKRLNVSAALFYIRQKGVYAIDTASDGKCLTNDVAGTCYVNSTVQRSRGIELETSGEVLPGLQVLAGYTFNLTRSSTGGAVSPETPKHLLRASASYTLPGAWDRLSIGGGVSAQSGYRNDAGQGVDYGAAGYAVWDARIAWKLDEHWTLGLNGDNLFDRKYYAAAAALDRGNLYGDPRSYMLTLRGDF
ncbi:Ferripyoverdine receptor precursor [Pseudomonas putida]|uniref:Ferripyoverdine receptor n=2 Tax=Pseudomonas putida TaxID=303 RepID=A0A1Q9R491_PSEPU|nr:TonB-dependent receptor [Pseudomonas putida]OLS62236.1 Ferripyoverdine receptor precursor [Pseudomonas putida]